jgi:site-specific DNA-cytosine methylase
MTEYYAKYGYAATFLRVDTKNHYVPHTRTRVYLLAIDMTLLAYARLAAAADSPAGDLPARTLALYGAVLREYPAPDHRPDGWADLIERSSEGWQKRSWVGTETSTTADLSTATRVGETRFEITP